MKRPVMDPVLSCGSFACLALPPFESASEDACLCQRTSIYCRRSLTYVIIPFFLNHVTNTGASDPQLEAADDGDRSRLRHWLADGNIVLGAVHVTTITELESLSKSHFPRSGNSC